ncbi:acyl-CoA dehydrogenase family protein [Streptomyces kunmingensis]|uniref:Acyl-CoA dehydrogenase family protein n=1 Tax=Streptomyces kunmingensis TaxID=68225 RepID=A0ABU6C9D6_9ACTN|nr:acyl-CoA dehydrogenase family protein [Streptomyces kunmingensis]MEB3961327.1 acyl-CoA dehydrogenase family protein [Streptomyces kunmingensis]
MDLTIDAEDAAFQERARAWLAAHVPDEPLPSLETGEGFAAHREWERELAADHWSVVSWPERYGGQDAGLVRWLLFEEAYYAAGAPGRVSQNGISLLAPTLFDYGTDEQRARILPSMARGETVWAQAWSEPEAGSDLASLRSTAVRAPGGWLLNGQKAWSSRAAFADRAFGLFRTDPATARTDRPHRGLTYLMFDLRAPGVTVRPVPRLDGKPAFAELFLDDVFVPDADVIGEPGQGWRIAMSATGSERGLTLRSPGRFLAGAAELERQWRDAGDPDDTALRDRVADAVIGARAYELFTWTHASRALDGEDIGAESSLNKVFWSEYDVALHETALELDVLERELADSRWAEGYVFALAGPIYAGTNEIQRDIIAERLLGLPKGRR